MKKIKFYADDDLYYEICQAPSPSIKNLPEWYKKTSPRIDNDNIHHILPNGSANMTIKACIPVFDSMTCGYMITLPCDVEFLDSEVYDYRVKWSVEWQVINKHYEKQTDTLVLPKEYDPSAFKWEVPWVIETPPGYSLLYTHPFYRYDLPFISGTGIVDSDRYDVPVNIPFFIKKDFCGIVPMGTPIAQVIPIKRERWISEKSIHPKNSNVRYQNLKLQLKKSYKKRWWQKKYYE